MRKALVASAFLAATSGVALQAAAQETVSVDGSSTVYPIAEAIAEEFQTANRGQYQITVGLSGTGGGFEKFCRGEIPVSNASRPIEQDEIEVCQEAGIEFIELPVALDALTIVVNPENDWVDRLTVQELQAMWAPAAQGEVTTWNQVRAGWPNEPLSLFGPGTDSGTYDYFLEAVLPDDESTRTDFTASEDDNVIVQGVQGNTGALGFLGLAYYEENQDTLKAVPISYEGGEPVMPSLEAAQDATYQPFSRPLFIYINTQMMQENQAVRAYVDMFTNPETASLVEEVGYVPLPADSYPLAQQKVESGTTGSSFEGGAQTGISLDQLLRSEG